MDFENIEHLAYVLEVLYRQIAKGKDLSPSLVRAGIEELYGPYVRVFGEFVPKPADECELWEIRYRIECCFDEAVAQGVDMSDYKEVWKHVYVGPRRMSRPKKQNIPQHEKFCAEVNKAALQRASNKSLITRHELISDYKLANDRIDR